MILLHAAPMTWGPLSGPNASVPGLVAAQNRLPEVTAALIATLGIPAEPPKTEFPVFDSKLLLGSPDKLDLPAPFNRPDLVVFHSTYIPVHARIARKLRKLGIPYVICPRGGMTRYAQVHKWLKKRLGNLLFFNKLVSGAAALHCLTPGEAAASSGWNRPVFVVGNGVDLPPLLDPTSREKTSGPRIVFMGRLHVDHKGLDMLVDASAMVHAELLQAGARVELYGPDCDGSTEFLKVRIARLGVQDVVTVNDPVVGEAKTALLHAADVFLHPSRTEGHPIAVLEALAHGLPCMLTPNTNMAEEVAAAGAGWRVDPSSAGIAVGLREVLALDKNRLREAGLRARRLAAEKYTWRGIASHSVEAYRRCAA